MNDGSKISLIEFLKLLWINFKVAFFNLIQFIKVIFRYYSNLSFAKADVSLILMYFFSNPFRVSRNFLAAKGESDLYQYGETPLTTLDLISRECGINKSDHVFELGCGRGKTCFWLSCFKGCKVTGIDYVPFFIEHAQRINKKMKLAGLSFILGDYLKADLTGATFIYLYGSNLDDDVIRELTDKLETLPIGTKVVTTSFALEDYTSTTNYTVIKCFSAPFVWGTADIYLQVKTR